MRYVQIGSEPASVIGLGTWRFGAKEWGWDASHKTGAIAIVQRALELGVNFIDTAEIYGRGESESIIGEALAGARDRALLATKLFPIWPTPKRIQRAAARSLKRLRTDHVELYQVHWPNPLIPLNVQMRGLRALVDSGRTRSLGVSNFTLRMWQRAERALGAPIVSNQVHYNLLKRGAEKMLPWAQANGRIIIAYSPLAQGLLSGKYDLGESPRDVRKFNTLFTRSNRAAARRVAEALREIASAHRATPGQIALAWLVHHPNVIAIPGARSLQQVEENAAAADIQLTECEFERLNETSAAFHRAGWRGLPEFARQLTRRRFASRTIC